MSNLLTEWRRMRPESGLCAHNARLADQQMTFGAAKGNQSAHGVPSMARRAAGAINATVDRH